MRSLLRALSFAMMLAGWACGGSPVHSKVLFTAHRDGNAEIYVMNSDGSSQTRLTNSSGFDGNPTWSPDGSRVAFTSDRDGNLEIYVMRADGTHQTHH